MLEIDEPAVVVGHSFGGGVAIRLAHDIRSRVRSLVLVNSIGGSSWRRGNTLRSIAERPLWDWGLHFPSDVWPLRQATRVVPVMAEDFVPNLLRNPRAMMRVANLARRADLRHELEAAARSAACRSRIIWATRDGDHPARVVRGAVRRVGRRGHGDRGPHSWLLAEPDRFGEVITNDLHVAKAARELEQQHAPKSAPHAASAGVHVAARRVGPRRAAADPAMRRSPRRRVMPRASSSVSSGTAYLRVVPSASRNCDMVNPSGCAREQRGRAVPPRRRRRRGGSRCRRARRRGRGATSSRSSRGRTPVGVGRRSAAGAQRGDERVVGERVGGAGDGRDAARRRRRPSSVGEHGPLRARRARPRRAQRAGRRRRRAASAAIAVAASGSTDPAADRRRDAARR